MHHWQNFTYIEPYSADAYLYGERELRLINLKALRGSWASTPTQGGLPFQHQFNSSSLPLIETIGKWVLLMWRMGTLWGAVITNKTTKLKIRIPISLCMQFTWLWLHATTTKYDHLSLRLESNKSFLIRLHSSSDTSTLVHIRLHLSVIRLHSSTLVCTRLVTCLCF